MQAGECWECGKKSMEIHYHHPVPRSRGGTKIIPLCLGCHAKAHHGKKNMASSILTKEGLRKAKAKGVKLGNPRLAEAREISYKSMKKNADAFAAKVIPYISTLRAQGLGFEKIAEKLNDMGLKTRRRGGSWHGTTVKRVLDRLESDASR